MTFQLNGSLLLNRVSKTYLATFLGWSSVDLPKYRSLPCLCLELVRCINSALRKYAPSSTSFTGPLDAVNNVIRDVAVAAQPSGSWLVTVSVSDNGHIGAGSSLSFTSQIRLQVSGNSTWEPSSVMVSLPSRWIIGRPAVILRGSSTSLADVYISDAPVTDALVEVKITPPAPAYSVYVDFDLVPDIWARAAFSSISSSFVVLRGPSRVINAVMHAIFIKAEKFEDVTDGL